jgi:ABC-type sugar transport system substrate-binding protein
MGCERSDGPPSGDARALRGALVAVIGPAEGHPQWPGIRGGAERFAAGNPSLRLLCTAPREEWGETLATAVERVLSDRPAIVCLWITDPEAAAPSVARIANQQVVLVTMNARATAGYPAAHVDLDWSSAAFAAAASRQYDLTLLEARRGTGDPRAAVEELLGRFSHAGLVITLNPDVWLTARAGWDGELRARKRQIRFARLSAAPVLWARLGTPAAPGDAAALVGPLDGQIGYAAVELAARLLLGTQRATLERVISCELVTPETLADFAQRYAAAANGLDVSKWLPRTTTAPAAR